MPTRIAFLSWVLALSACATHSDSVCEDLGLCRTWRSAQVKSCQSQTKALEHEAASSGCASESGTYFTCADEKYQCVGNAVSYPGCDNARAALDSCLERERTNNACGALARALAACPGESPRDGSTPPAPCGAAEVCTSRCYLDNVPDICRPEALELMTVAQCAQQCPL